MSKLGERLRRERRQRHMSQQKVADALHTLANEHPLVNRKELPPHLTTIGRWEKGKHFPSPYYRRLLCQFFTIPEDEFLRLHEQSLHARGSISGI